MAFIGASSAIDMSVDPLNPALFGNALNFYTQSGDKYYYGIGEFGEGLDLTFTLSGTKMDSVAYFIDGSIAFYIDEINLGIKQFERKTTKSGFKGLLHRKDTVFGSDFNDTLLGGAKNDTLYGQSGNDRLIGGSGRDKLFGGAGNDTLIGGKGKDIMRGDAGRDTFVIRRGQGHDIIKDFSNQDQIRVQGFNKNRVRVVERGDDALLFAGKDLLARVVDGAGMNLI